MTFEKPTDEPAVQIIAQIAGEPQFQALIETALDIVVVLDYDGVIRYVSPSVRRVTGYSPEEMIGESPFTYMHPDDAERQMEVFRNVVSDPDLVTVGEPRSFRFRHKDGYWIVLEAVSTKLPQGPEPPGIVINARDVTQRAQAHESMRETAESERRFAQENEVIAEIGRIISSTLDIEEVYQPFASQVRNLIDFDVLSICIVERDGGPVRIAHLAGDSGMGIPVGTVVPIEGSLTGEVAKLKHAIIFQGVSEDEIQTRYHVPAASYQSGARSWVCAPLINGGEFVGSLLVLSSRENAFTERDVDLAQRVGNQIAGAIGSSRLYADLKKAEVELAASNDRNQMILETAHDAFVGIDDDGRVIAWNSQAETTFGWTAAEAVGRMLSGLIIPERFAGEHSAGMKHFLATGDGPVMNQRIEMVAKRRDGQEFPVELTISPLRLGDRYIFNAFVRDITGRREAETALRRSEERFRAVYNNAANGIGTRTLDGTIKDLNPAFLNMVGYTLDEVKALGPGELYDTSYVVFEKGLWERALQGEDIPPYEKVYFRKDGSKVFTEVRASLERDDDGNTIGIVTVVTDITERKQLEEEIDQHTKSLEIANTELQQLDRMKDEFISTVSHELRTPLTSIKGSAELLLSFDDDDRETQVEFLQIINKECDRLTRLIDDVLDLSRMESRQMRWFWDQFELAEAVNRAVDGTHALVMQKDLSVRVDLDPDLPHLWNDRDRLVQVVTNLLSNSIKFTPRGGEVRITAKRLAADGSDGLGEKLEVCVSDTGIGIQQVEFENIFQKFKQVGDTPADKPRGTGLGLAICKEIVGYFGGKIWVESTYGEGSSFYFTVPVASKEQVPGPDDAANRPG